MKISGKSLRDLLNTAIDVSLPIEPVGMSPLSIGVRINLSSSGVYE